MACSCLLNLAPGCKRIVLDNGYLRSLHRPNVNVAFERIDSITSEGIRLMNGSIVPLDVIIFGTGFDLVSAHWGVRFVDYITAPIFQSHT